MTSPDTPERPRPVRRGNAVPVEAPAAALYPAHTTLTERQLRQLVQAESSEALELARRAGLETP